MQNYLTSVLNLWQNPRPHISLAWALGDVSCKLKQAIKEIEKSQSSLGTSQISNLRCKFSHVVCKIGKKVYDICKLADWEINFLCTWPLSSGVATEIYKWAWKQSGSNLEKLQYYSFGWELKLIASMLLINGCISFDVQQDSVQAFHSKKGMMAKMITNSQWLNDCMR